MSIQGKEEGSEVPDVRVSVYKERRQTALTLHGENIRADSTMETSCLIIGLRDVLAT
jgi:hypothetical protein